MQTKEEGSQRNFVGLLLIILVAVPLFALEFMSMFAGYSLEQNIMSRNWAGYMAVSGAFQGTAVNASWTVPEVNVSAGDGCSSIWIGIGGQFDGTLIQVGTDHCVLNGQANYTVWYEALPAASVTFTNLSILPQDTMVASIVLSNPETNQWTIKISDMTNKKEFSTNIIYTSTCSSVEWIVERPTINNQICTLADFGDVTFTGCCASISNVNYPIAEFPFSKLQMVDTPNTELTSVSPLTAGGSSFTVSYLNSGKKT